MQAVRRRVGQAVRQEGRKRLRDRNKFRHDYERDRFRETQNLKGKEIQQIRTAQRIRKEDYELGPLAPRRDAGKDAERYGTIDGMRYNRVEVPKWKRQWCGIEVGDRVVMLKGVDKGKIAQVDEKDEESETVKIRDLNMAEMHLPEWVRESQGHNNPTVAFAMPVSWHDVRLVYPLVNRRTREKRDVIIENLEQREVYFDEETLESDYERVIPELPEQPEMPELSELGYPIPYPNKQAPRHQDHDGDTLRITVEQRTWLPTLNEDPFPPSVIDELRNKYSKYRVPDKENFLLLRRKHEENKKMRDIRWMESMRTPLQELHALRAERRREELREKGLEAPMPEVELKRGKKWKWKARPREEEPVDEEFLARMGSMLAEKKGTSSSAQTMIA